VCCPQPASADPDDFSAQIDLIGVPWPMLGEDAASAPNGGYRAQAADQAGHPA
jgi:hypothetical protein